MGLREHCKRGTGSMSVGWRQKESLKVFLLSHL